MTTTWQIGAVTVTKVPQMTWRIPLAGLVPEATGPACAEVAPGLVAEDGTAEISLHGLVVESAGHRILVDTCAGHDDNARAILALVAEAGAIDHHHPDVATAVDAAGWSPTEIDTVVCTHLHFDHVGGNLSDGAPAFPAARYVVAGDEWGHWSTATDDGDYGSVASVTENVRPLVERGLVDLVDPDHRLTDEVRFLATPGHTPGHVSVLIDSGGEQAVITGDLAHHPVEFLAPHWAMSADVDPGQATATRRAFVDRFGDGRTLVLGTHFGGSSAGRLHAGAATWTPA